MCILYKMDKQANDTLMKEVIIIKNIYNNTGKIMCRKCRKCKDAIRVGKNLKDFNSTSKEQYISGICSDKCWDECCEGELMTYKFIAPLYLHSECVIQTINMCNPDTHKMTKIDHKKNSIYKK